MLPAIAHPQYTMQCTITFGTLRNTYAQIKVNTVTFTLELFEARFGGFFKNSQIIGSNHETGTKP